MPPKPSHARRLNPCERPAVARPRAAAALTVELEEADDASHESRAMYHAHWKRLAEIEWQAEQDAVADRMRWPAARLEREGLCLTGLTATSLGRFFDRLQVRFALPERWHRPDVRHEFSVGDTVIPRGGTPALWLRRARSGRRWWSCRRGRCRCLSDDGRVGDLRDGMADGPHCQPHGARTAAALAGGARQATSALASCASSSWRMAGAARHSRRRRCCAA